MRRPSRRQEEIRIPPPIDKACGSLTFEMLTGLSEQSFASSGAGLQAGKWNDPFTIPSKATRFSKTASYI